MRRATFSEVRARVGGLKGVITKLNDAPDHEHKWKAFPKCPFCSGKNCAGVFTKGDAEFFKCHHRDCSTGGTVMTEVGYIAAREGLSEAKPPGGGPSEAYKRLLQLAGMWEEPGQGRGRSQGAGSKSQVPASRGSPGSPALSAPVGEDFSGAALPVAPMAASPAETQDALPSGAAPGVSPSPAPVPSSDGAVMPDGGGASTAVPHPPAGPAGAASSLSQGGVPDAAGALEAPVAGKVGKKKGKADKPAGVDKATQEKARKAVDRIVKSDSFTIPAALVHAAHGLAVELGALDGLDGFGEDGSAEGDGAGASGGDGESSSASSGRVVVTNDESLEVLRFVYEQLEVTDEDLAKWDDERAIAPCVARACGLRSNRKENLPVLQSLVPRFSVGACVAAGLWERAAGDDDGARSGDAAEWWAKRFPAGFVPQVVDGCSPSRFFFGFGQVARIKFASAWGTPARRTQLESLKRDLGKRHADLGPLNFWEQEKHLMVSGFNGQPIIPYLDWLPPMECSAGSLGGLDLGCITEGELKAIAWWSVFADGVRQMAAPDAAKLIALRTHKKWAKGAKTHCFLTRPGGGSVRFAGRTWRPGVAAMPGISFGRKRGGTWTVRHELDEWLRLNGMTGAIVAYDNEEKGDPSLPGYNDEVEDRFDAVTWGLVLARDLGRERKSWLMMLPESLRNKDGKVDWDGALKTLREAGGQRRREDAKRGGEHKGEGGMEKGEVDEPPVVPAPKLDLDGEENPFNR